MSSKRLFFANNVGRSIAVARAQAGDAGALGVATFTRADASTCATQVSSASVIGTVLANVLRDSHYIGGYRTILLEGTRANLSRNAGDVSNGSWGKGNATIGAASTAPDGGATAYNVIPTTTGANRSVFSSNGLTVAAYTFSIFARANGISWVTLGRIDGANVGAMWFNVLTRVISATAPISGYTAGIELLGPNFARIWVTATAAAATQYLNAFLADADQSMTSTNSGTNGVIMWGGQIELGAFPTSWIPTGALAITRAVDALSYAGVPFSGTLFYHYFDLATNAWTSAVAAYTAGSAIVPTVNRAYFTIAVVQGTRTVAECKAILGGTFPA